MSIRITFKANSAQDTNWVTLESKVYTRERFNEVFNSCTPQEVENKLINVLLECMENKDAFSFAHTVMQPHLYGSVSVEVKDLF